MLLGFRKSLEAICNRGEKGKSCAVLGWQHDTQGDLWRSEALSVRKTTQKRGKKRKKKGKGILFGKIPKSSP